MAALYLAAPANTETWQRLASEGEEAQEIYWNAIPARRMYSASSDGLTFGVRQLIEARRSLDVVNFLSISGIPNDLVVQVLAQAPIDHATQVAAGRQPYIYNFGIGHLFEKLDRSDDVSDERIAQLEIPYIQIMDEWQRRPALHREVLRHPSLFADVISWPVKRSDGQLDDDIDEEMRRNRAHAASQILQGLRGLPGMGDDGAVDVEVLDAWVNEARRLCCERDREIIGDQQIGQVLATRPSAPMAYGPANPCATCWTGWARHISGKDSPSASSTFAG